MDNLNRKTINKYWSALIEDTNFETILKYMSDKNVFTQTEMRRMTGAEFSEKETAAKNDEFYTTIMTRGPEAFERLVQGLHATGHPELAKKLDPTYYTRLAKDEEQQQLPRYEDDGTRVIFIDNTWNHEACKSDREALAKLFKQYGYQEHGFKLENVEGIIDNVKEEASSCVILKFSKYTNEANGIYMDEDKFIHGILLDKSLEGKPKILISLRYVFTQTDACPFNDGQNETQPSTRRVYSDILWVKVYVDGKGKGTEPSTVVQNIMDVCSTNHNLPFTRQINKVVGLSNKHTIEVDSMNFSKEYYLKVQEK